MQFKREDIGLYVATALIGGGLGLLAGAFLTARINRKREEDFNAADAARDESSEPHPYYQKEFAQTMDTLSILEEELPPIADRIEVMKKAATGLEKIKMAKAKKVIDDDFSDRVIPGKQEESHRLSKDDRYELTRLMEEYVVTGLQIELVEKGTISVEELEEVLEEDERNEEALLVTGGEVVDYGKQYRIDEKPDLEDLLERPINDLPALDVNDLLVTVGETWEILLSPPEGKSENQKRTLYFDPTDELVYTKSSGGDLMPADLRVIANKEVQEIIMPWLLFEKEMEVIYVDDIRSKKTRWYEIVRLKEDDPYGDQ